MVDANKVFGDLAVGANGNLFAPGKAVGEGQQVDRWVEGKTRDTDFFHLGRRWNQIAQYRKQTPMIASPTMQ